MNWDLLKNIDTGVIIFIKLTPWDCNEFSI